MRRAEVARKSIEFQFTRPRGARRRRYGDWACQCCFNSRARVGRDRNSRDEDQFFWFQFTRPRGARLLSSCRWRTEHRGFNSRARVGRDRASSKSFSAFRSFNSRARVGRDLAASALADGENVSIHAPAWGATNGRIAHRRFGSVSIHAPAWGATRRSRKRNGWIERFNSRARVGRDTKHAALVEKCPCFNSRARVGRDRAHRAPQAPAEVSIHAPAWGATSKRSRSDTHSSSFNSRARVGRDKDCKMVYDLEKLFQFTRPRGARRSPLTRDARKLRFNSRARVGRDAEGLGNDARGQVSIHAPAWGATRLWNRPSTTSHVSIHAPAWGATGPRGIGYSFG